ncbi:uncharacterized protein LOC141748148 [Larus michahellis]|uniref:uncharacterized protein LOC141748148 n=1 Tax=Larus michahellis TaxID=119627 RepID=UPI003D9B6651
MGDMSSLRGCCTLCSVLLLAGGSLAVLVQIHQDSLNGTVGQSVLLPISYTVDAASRFPVSIHWTFRNSSNTIITCTVSNCSLGPGGAPRNCSASCFPKHTYRGRAEFFSKNASLLLRHLKLSDSGVYSVTFGPSFQTWHISLAVHEQHFPPECPDTEPAGGGGTAPRIPCYVFGGCYCFILLFLQLLLHLPWLRPNSREASNTEPRSVSHPWSRQRRPQPGAAPPRGATPRPDAFGRC